VALDTPSRATGIYISGGVMAAPTVGAVLGDILPYLGVERHYDPEELAYREIVIDDMTGMTRTDAEMWLKQNTLMARFVGSGETVTGQIPSAGKTVPGGSQMLIYMGENVPEVLVTVPNLTGMNRAQATEAAGKLGLYILHMGNNANTPDVVVTSQNIPAGTEVAAGSTIQLEFTDTGARD
jgi:stage V sporulation protein D (sporulation-specific penicillin-binding protein)